MTHTEILFQSYNNTIEMSYEKLLKTSQKDKRTKINPDEIESLVEDVIKKWYDLPLKDIDNLTPREYISGLSESQIIDAFVQGAKMCDELPELIEHKLKSFEDISVEEFLKIISDTVLIQDDQDFVIPLAAIGLLGKWRVEKAVEPLIELLFKINNDNELFMDHISIALSNIGVVAQKPLIERIEELEPKGEVFNSLLYALSLIGEKNKSDAIYISLRSSFLRMEDKVYAAACLGDYGDPRAIPLIRGFIEKNKKSITKKLYYGLRHEVESLGGKMDDILVDFLD